MLETDGSRRDGERFEQPREQCRTIHRLRPRLWFGQIEGPALARTGGIAASSLYLRIKCRRATAEPFGRILTLAVIGERREPCKSSDLGIIIGNALIPSLPSEREARRSPRRAGLPTDGLVDLASPPGDSSGMGRRRAGRRVLWEIVR
jgi:hypothetical protein